jgi:two-component system, NarL family, nitrate/nitrite response regulator NarL
MIRVFIIADVCLYREGLATILDRHANVEVVGTAKCAADAIDKIRGLEPRAQIVLVDVSAPGGISLVSRILRALPGLCIVALTVKEVEHEVVACAEAGATAYVPRDATARDLVAVIESASRGEALCSPVMTAALLRRISELARPARGGHLSRMLTAREVEVAELIEQGLSNKQIAGRLHVELPTVKNHVHRILEKLGVHRRTDAAAWVRSGNLARR